jgi:multidrug efflux pump subunit AcrA (membrane-fusion protein)
LIPGKIEKWYVKEGDYVEAGDTLVFLSEVKEKYIDPALLSRTRAQMDAKIQSAQAYADKANALTNQGETIAQVRDLKLAQTRNYIQQALFKVQADSISLQASESQFAIAKKQFERMDQLYKQGLKSLTEWEEKKQKLQDAEAYMISAESKFMSSKAALTNAQVELISVEQEYQEKILKTQADQLGSMSGFYDADASLTKLENELTNLQIRNGMYFITADQAGYVTKILQQGVGGIVKEDEVMLTIMPAVYDLAVELYVAPTDLPLMQKGQSVQLFFDGIPSIVFTGWPDASYGVFSGEIVAIDQYISSNGLYRMIVFPNNAEKPWPEQLRIGAGSQAYILLNEVPAWYEAWRRLNGFPPNFYTQNTLNEK